DADGFQAVHEPDSLLVSHVLVQGAVNAQRGGGVGRYPVERAGNDVTAQGVVQVAAQPEGEHFGGVDAFAVRFGEVAGAVIVHHTAYAAGLVQVAAAALKTLDVRGDAEKLREMAARRTTHDADALGIDVILLGAGPQPADCFLDVMNGRGELVLGRQAVT